MLAQLELVVVALQLLALLPHIGSTGDNTALASGGNVTEVQSVVGLGAFLPCNIQPIDTDRDEVTLVLWFRPPSLTPFYSYDTVESEGPASHWAASPSRHSFSPSPSAQAGLFISETRSDDGGLYRCRADFKRQQTVIHWVKLSILVPPKRVKIFETGTRRPVSDAVEVLSPQGGIALTCEVEGGEPPPAVRWLRDGTLIDASFHSSSTKSVVTNALVLPFLTREDMFTQLSCEASNNDMSKPLTLSTSLHLKYLPEKVRISTVQESPLQERPLYLRMVDGVAVHLQCTVSGAQPSPSVSWWRGELRLAESLQQALGDGTVVSSIHLTPGRRDHEIPLRCRAEVPGLHGAEEDRITMHVAYPPMVRITTGAFLNLSSIQEGQDIYFLCQIDANPPATEFSWLFNDDELQPGSSPGMLASGHSLAIQAATRDHSGDYACSARNNLGKRTSGKINLDINYVPECTSGKVTVYKGFVSQQLSVKCQVRANPSSALTFRWTFNSSVDNYEQEDWHPEGNLVTSVATFTPHSEDQFGTISCSADTAVGQQKTPCRFLTIPLLAPPPPDQCQAHNVTHSSFQVSCLPPPPSASPIFSLTAILPPTGEVVHTSSSATHPYFRVANLQAGTSYIVSIVAKNSNGDSEPVVLTVTTSNIPDMAERRLREGASANSPSSAGWWMLVLGLACSVIVTLVLVIVTAALRRNTRRGQDTTSSDWPTQIRAPGSPTRAQPVHNNGQNNGHNNGQKPTETRLETGSQPFPHFPHLTSSINLSNTNLSTNLSTEQLTAGSPRGQSSIYTTVRREASSSSSASRSKLLLGRDNPLDAATRESTL